MASSVLARDGIANTGGPQAAGNCVAGETSPSDAQLVFAHTPSDRQADNPYHWNANWSLIRRGDDFSLHGKDWKAYFICGDAEGVANGDAVLRSFTIGATVAKENTSGNPRVYFTAENLDGRGNNLTPPTTLALDTFSPSEVQPLSGSHASSHKNSALARDFNDFYGQAVSASYDNRSGVNESPTAVQVTGAWGFPQSETGIAILYANASTYCLGTHRCRRAYETR